jgi:hypothetical protein
MHRVVVPGSRVESWTVLGDDAGADVVLSMAKRAGTQIAEVAESHVIKEVVFLPHGFPYDIHGYAEAPAGNGGPSCLSPRARANPVPGQHGPAIGTESSHRHRCHRPDGCGRHPARHGRRL